MSLSYGLSEKIFVYKTRTTEENVNNNKKSTYLIFISNIFVKEKFSQNQARNKDSFQLKKWNIISRTGWQRRNNKKLFLFFVENRNSIADQHRKDEPDRWTNPVFVIVICFPLFIYIYFFSYWHSRILFSMLHLKKKTKTPKGGRGEQEMATWK